MITSLHSVILHLVLQCRACVVFDDRLYIIGGQEGDFMAKPGSPIFKCSRRNEVMQSSSIRAVMLKPR